MKNDTLFYRAVTTRPYRHIDKRVIKNKPNRRRADVCTMWLRQQSAKGLSRNERAEIRNGDGYVGHLRSFRRQCRIRRHCHSLYRAVTFLFDHCRILPHSRLVRFHCSIIMAVVLLCYSFSLRASGLAYHLPFHWGYSSCLLSEHRGIKIEKWRQPPEDISL